MKVWITKYALSTGIYPMVADHSDGDVLTIYHGSRLEFFHKREWHESFESAKRRAEAMRDRKVASLEKQLARLRALRFDNEQTTSPERGLG